MADIPTLSRLLRRFGRDQSAGLAVGFGLALGGMAVAAGAAVDYASASTQRFRLQSVADAAAMAGAREFRLGNANERVIRDAVLNHARSALSDRAEAIEFGSAADVAGKTATATLAMNVPTYVMHLAGSRFTSVSARATAKMTGGAPICVVGLETDANQTVELEKTAQLSAPNCAIYSNSKKPNGLVIRNLASMRASFICSAGGVESPGAGSFSPTPKTDCPILPDPLKSRPLPVAGGCTATNLVLKGTMVNLNPGTYCGGLTIDANATVTFFPGVYIFRNGPLVVTGGSRLSGTNVGLHFTGSGASLKFDPDTVISLTAPKSGDMAGLLITEDRGNPLGQQFEINSNDARTLLGTIYIPQGRLYVAAKRPVGDLSAYTIVVARRFSLSEGPTMVLNTNYGATDIPVPNGVGPSNAMQLTH